MSPNAGGGVLAMRYNCEHGAQINFGDLAPYLNYVLGPKGGCPNSDDWRKSKTLGLLGYN